MADLVVSRAGATTLFEILALKKPNLLIPLSRKASRGDQILNANSFMAQGFSICLEEGALNQETLLNAVLSLYKGKENYFRNMDRHSRGSGIKAIIEVLENCSKKTY